MKTLKYLFFTCIVSIVALTSCGTSNEPEMQNESIKLVKRYWEVMNSNDFIEVSKHFSTFKKKEK